MPRHDVLLANVTSNSQPLSLARFAAIVSTVSLLAVAVALVVFGFQERNWALALGLDRATYIDGAQRWLHGGSFYLDRQLHGPYDIHMGDLMYPPTLLWLLVPFSFLPAPFWWAVPIGFVAWSVLAWRPAARTWPLLALCLAWPNTTGAFVTGYPGLWVCAAIAAGLRWGWPGALVLLKPSLLPFALIGIRTRGWWAAVAALVLLTLPMLAMIPDWLHSVFDAQGSGGLLHSANELPLMMIPILAWLGSSRSRGRSSLAGGPQYGPGASLPGGETGWRR